MRYIDRKITKSELLGYTGADLASMATGGDAKVKFDYNFSYY